jgi:hypothetical protein
MTSGIIEILIENAGVQALEGIRNTAGTKYKVYPTVCPQGETQPYIIVSMVSNDGQTSLDKTNVSGLDYPQYNVLCYATNFRTTELMHAACRAAIDNIEATTDAGAEFERIWMVNERDLFDNQAQLYVKTTTYKAEVKR